VAAKTFSMIVKAVVFGQFILFSFNPRVRGFPSSKRFFPFIINCIGGVRAGDGKRREL
jgi:hypothetical protein